MKGKLLLLMPAALLFCTTSESAPVGTAFTYQGQLRHNGQLATNGVYGLSFSLYNAAITPPGAIIGSAIEQSVPVTNSIFTVTLDFGAGAFAGEARWLEISVNTNTVSPTPGYLVLAPRTRITPAPNAIYALAAGTVTNGAIGVDHLAAGTPTAGQVLTYDGAAMAWQGVSAVSGAWSVNGNSAAPGQFLGTTSDQALEFRANNARVLRMEPNATSPNLIGGWGGNAASTGVSGAVVAGGGAGLVFGLAASNRVSDDFGTISGGARNLAGNTNELLSDAYYATVGGGHFNLALGIASTIAGGAENRVANNNSFVGGGYQNNALAYISTIGGGQGNVIVPTGSHSVIGGGADNIIDDLSILSVISGGWVNRIQTNSESSTIAGGQGNRVQNNSSIATIGGGYYNTIGSHCAGATISGGDANTLGDLSADATIGGGYRNAISVNSPNATLSGGISNTVAAESATIGGGVRNTIDVGAFESTIGGGGDNLIAVFADGSTIGGGTENTIDSADYSTISGGYQNTVNYGAFESTIGGGAINRIHADAYGSTIGGGGNNRIEHDADSSTIGGGYNNAVRHGQYATIAGGRENLAGYAETSTGNYSSVGGGQLNNAQGHHATVPGGLLNWAPGNFSFAAGRRAKAYDAGSFVWADSTDADFGYGGVNKFQVRASGGVLFYANAAGNVGVYLAPGGSSWAPTSDRNAKENFREINPREVLAKVVALPILNYNLKSQTNTIRHLGPMAQDFYAAFQLGEDDKHITTIDADGVALAAIQGLHQIVQEQRSELDKKEARITGLEQRLEKLEQLLNQQHGGVRRSDARSASSIESHVAGCSPDRLPQP